jgi:3-hydroxy-D-aspartate aldolase
LLTSVAGELAADGHRGEIISAGGTGTYEVTGRCAGVTELQAGSYVAMDSFHADLIGGFEVAVTVQASVLSRHGDLVILDAGRKAIGVEPGIPHAAGRPGETIFVNEEHLALRLAGGEIPHVGDQLALVSGYAPATVNLYDVYHVLEDGVVVDLWPVHARYGSQTTGV